MFTVVAAANVEAYWPKLAPWILQAIGPEGDTYDLEYIKGLAQKGVSHIWVGHREAAKIEMVLVTETLFYGARKTLVLRWFSGVDPTQYLEDLGLLEMWAKQQGFEKIEVWGRKGWEHKLKPHGFRYSYTVLERYVDRELH